MERITKIKEFVLENYESLGAITGIIGGMFLFLGFSFLNEDYNEPEADSELETELENSFEIKIIREKSLSIYDQGDYYSLEFGRLFTHKEYLNELNNISELVEGDGIRVYDSPQVRMSYPAKYEYAIDCKREHLGKVIAELVKRGIIERDQILYMLMHVHRDKDKWPSGCGGFDEGQESSGEGLNGIFKDNNELR